MSLKKRMILTAVFPVLILGGVVLILSMTKIRASLLQEIQNSLKGTAAATLAAYDQNTGEYLQTENGDVWKGGYNISKSENLVDGIKKKTGMDVTFFYGTKRIMTSALDKNNKRILGSPAGEMVEKKVLQEKKEYFSKNVSVDGTIYYGYFLPVAQEGDENQIVGMIFVGTPKGEKDASVYTILMGVAAVVFVMMVFGILFAARQAMKISSGLSKGVSVLQKVSKGELEVEVDASLLKRKDELGALAQAVARLQEELRNVITGISANAKDLQKAADLLGTTAEETNDTMRGVEEAVNEVADISMKQAESSRETSENVNHMGEKITEAYQEVELLDKNAKEMNAFGLRARDTLNELKRTNDEVETSVEKIAEQTNKTNASVQKIQEVTTLIQSIADETNLLSLNASIEAARAGESGRGFAVVAEQIQKLAEQSAESSTAIQEIIDKLIVESNASVDLMEHVQEITTCQSENMEKTKVTVEDVLEGIARAVQSIEQIEQITGQLAQVRNGIVTGVDELSQVAQENAQSSMKTSKETDQVAAAFAKISDSTGQLREIADQLVKSMEYFMIPC
ncbi:MAG: methyl-accepting chemotaxis protein [Lachnospiraceae bacterium]